MTKNNQYFEIQQETIDKIADIPILEVCQKLGIELKKSGSTYQTNCPFHDEKTPSFTVSPAKNIFKCFGCGEAGGPIKLAMAYKNIAWIDAIKHLAEVFRIEIKGESLTDEQRKHHLNQEANIIANEHCKKYFTQNLTGEALKYAKGRWSEDSIAQWGIGYAPDNWHGLDNWTQKNGIKREIAIKAGLLIENKYGKVYNFFRNRITFPIHNSFGRIVGYTARTLSHDAKTPKYINTKESASFVKGGILFGLFFARKSIIKNGFAYIVEGAPDIIKMHSLKADNTVAPLGTSMCEKQFRGLQRLCNNICFILETDDAGIAAVIKNATAAIKLGFFVSVLCLPEEKDTQGKRVKHDADSFFTSTNKFIEFANDNTESFIIWYANRFLANKTNPGKQLDHIDQICEMLSCLQSSAITEDHIYRLTKIVKPKSIWTKGIKSFKDQENKNFGDGVEKKSNINREIYDKYGFMEENNQLFFAGKDGTYRGANFILKPLFHIKSTTNSKRLYLMRNEKGYEENIELDQDDLVSLPRFRRAVESRGNFIWEARETELTKYKRCLYEHTKTCLEITQLGWQKEGFWAWGNGILFNNKFHPVDKDGIVTLNNKNWYLPAFSKIWMGEKEQFQFERKFIHKNEDGISLNDYAGLFIDVYGSNGIVGLCYLFAALFRDIVVKTTHNFPLLNMFGPKGAGKSELGISLMAFFMPDNKAPNIRNSTVPAINDAISQSANAIVHLDEFKNDIDYTKIELLKGIYDGTGRTRMNMERDKKRETTAVDSAVAFSGQEMPTADIALFSRLIFLGFSKTTYTDKEKKSFEKLKSIEEKGLSHLTCQLLSCREYVQNGWLTAYSDVSDELQVKLKDQLIEDRILRNWLVLASIFKVIEPHLNLPFCYKDVLNACAEGIKNQNNKTKINDELSNFWSTVEYLVKEGYLENEVDFYVKTVDSLKTDKMDKGFDKPKTILILNHTKTFPLYSKYGKLNSSQILPKASLIHYLKHCKEFLGMKKSQRFKNRDPKNGTIMESHESLSTKLKYQITTAYIFDYDKLNISIDYNILDEEESEDENNNEAVDMTEERPDSFGDRDIVRDDKLPF